MTRLLLIVLRRKGQLDHAGPHGEAAGLLRKQKGQGERVGKGFIVVYMGRNGRGRSRSQDWIA